MPTLVADVEARVVVRLLPGELDPRGRALAHHALEGDLAPPTRVEQNHGAGVQPAPQHQPGGGTTDQEQDRSRVALGPWGGEGDRTRPTVAFFTAVAHVAVEAGRASGQQVQNRHLPELEHAPPAGLRRRAVPDRQRVGGRADHLTLHQQRVVGQHQQGAARIHAADGQLLALRQVHALHLQGAGPAEVPAAATRRRSYT
ncbi:hypothetical protein EYF80_058362 [Liparis tanakae]|uniref:Uncharacterized protein n=1 Tax=Liparis tanakae TaxID=230148 RepID=A0A4Z2ERF2_9TELE|nr:hypothetical protein EYF80_058362 [Liparis tanakae]